MNVRLDFDGMVTQLWIDGVQIKDATSIIISVRAGQRPMVQIERLCFGLEIDTRDVDATISAPMGIAP